MGASSIQSGVSVRDPAKDFAILDGVAKGKTYTEIGKPLGITRQRVHQLLKRLRREQAASTQA